MISRSLSGRTRRSSNTGVTVELDFADLEQFLKQLCSVTEDEDIKKTVQDRFSGLAARCTQLQTGSNEVQAVSNELNEVVTILGAILSSAPDLPSKTVAQVHSFVGMIRARQKRPACAIQSFMKALWLQKSSGETQDLDIALTENQLGLAYGMSDDLAQAISLLEKALEDYEKAGMKPEHPCVAAAQSELSEFRTQHLDKLLHSTERPGKARRLSHIEEEHEHQSERRLSQWEKP